MPSEKRIIPEVEIDYQVDTLSLHKETNVVAYFTPSKNTVTSNYKLNDEKGNEYRQSDAVLLHEQKHRENAKRGLYIYPFSAEQAYKMNMHDEISATISELVYMREKYLQTGDLSIFDESTFFSFYTEAIEKGEIDPKSPYKEDFEKDMKLIVNGTRDAWEKMFAKSYNDNSMYYAQYSSDKSGKYAAFYDENYQRGMKIAYNIGGVDFSQYMDRDAEIPDVGKQRLKLLEIDLEIDKAEGNREFAERIGLPAFEGNMSLEQYQKLLYHQMFMNRFVETAPFDKDNYLDFICLNKVAYDTEKDASVKKSARESLDGFRDKYESCFEGKGIHTAVIGLVNLAARDYERRGEKLPAPNDAAYNRAVDNVYTRDFESNGDVEYKGKVNLRSILSKEEDVDRNLPEYAQSIEKRGLWQRGLNKWADFVGLSQEKIDNLNKQLDGAGALKRYGVGSLLYLGAPVVSAVENVQEKFFDKKDEQIANKQIREVNTDAPKYREWKNQDGSRVSEVLYRTLPDLTKDVIQKPTKSRAEENNVVANENGRPEMGQNVAKLKMERIIDYMNKVNGEEYAVDTRQSVDALCEKYGPQAYKLLLTAVNEPTNYAKIAGDSSIKTSREALLHLCSRKGEEQQKITEYAEAKAGVTIDAPQPQKQENLSPTPISNRISKMRSMLLEGHEDLMTAVRDNTNVASAWLERKRFEKAVEHKQIKPQAITAESLRNKLNTLREGY